MRSSAVPIGSSYTDADAIYQGGRDVVKLERVARMRMIKYYKLR